MTEHISPTLALVYAFAIVTLLCLLGLFCEMATGVIRKWWNGRAPLALKSRAERVNPMTDGCEMDAKTLGMPAEHSADARPHFIGHGGGL